MGGSRAASTPPVPGSRKRRVSLASVKPSLANKYYGGPLRRERTPRVPFVHLPVSDLDKRYGVWNPKKHVTKIEHPDHRVPPQMTFEADAIAGVPDPKYAFVKPTISPRNKALPKNAKAAPPPKREYREDPHPSDTIIDNYTTFEEYKNSRTFEDYYPKLFTAPHKVFPGRLCGTQYGDFDWFRSKPRFDWWNASNQPKQTYFRDEKFNEAGQPLGDRIVPAREVCRVPPTTTKDTRVDDCVRRTRSKSESCVHPETQKQPKDQKATKQGIIVLNRKYVPPVPRYPLVSNPSDGELIPKFGKFDPRNSMRRQQSDALLSYRSERDGPTRRRANTDFDRAG